MASAVTLGLVVQGTRYVCVLMCLCLWWGPDLVLLLLRFLDLVVGVISREPRLPHWYTAEPWTNCPHGSQVPRKLAGTQDRWCLTLCRCRGPRWLLVQCSLRAAAGVERGSEWLVSANRNTRWKMAECSRSGGCADYWLCQWQNLLSLSSEQVSVKCSL